MVADRAVVGILAPVDAGKTTLAEGILYRCKAIRRLGRVDHRDAFLDTDEMERLRGITIFSKQAELSLEAFCEQNVALRERLSRAEKAKRLRYLTLLDTPGHVDFSTEMERTLQVLDYAILVISGADGVQGHVMTLWKLLRHYHIPVFLFVNKMDQPSANREALLLQLQKRLTDVCVDFTPICNDDGVENREKTDAFYENIALCEDSLTEHFLKGGGISDEAIADLIVRRQVIPCFFGSALNITGVDGLLYGLCRFLRGKDYPDTFGARVFKITHDVQGGNSSRLTYLKITGGSAKVKMRLPGLEDKVDQIRIYSGAQYKAVDEIGAGGICAVTGWKKSYIGACIGENQAKKERQPLLQPVLSYRLECPAGYDMHRMLLNVKELEEEDPMLRVVWEERLSQLYVQVMGDVQMEVLKAQMLSRFGVEVSIGEANVVYRETIAEAVEGVGHYEPLRHYAEVHLLMEPLPPGSGLQWESSVSSDVLEINWQKQVLFHLAERRHRGVLCGGELTDVRMTLVAGRAHVKHTEGGDFRQAACRAVRQGLMCAKSVLLEPIFSFTLTIPEEMVGRAMSDIQRMSGHFDTPKPDGVKMILTGTAPVAKMREYAKEVAAYTRGFGSLSLEYAGYAPCHNTQEILAHSTYDPEADLEQPSCSVFCAHGAGFVVLWDQVRNYMHVDSGLTLSGFDRRQKMDGNMSKTEDNREKTKEPMPKKKTARVNHPTQDDELEEIFRRTYGERKTSQSTQRVVIKAEEKTRQEEGKYPEIKHEKTEEYLLVDGYNFLFSLTAAKHFTGENAQMWEDLKQLVQADIASAGDSFADLLRNYQGYTKKKVILVYDAYKVHKNPGEILDDGRIYVVYTKEAETADHYIERTVHRIAKNHRVTVATSDGVEQMIIFGAGAIRMPVGELREEMGLVFDQIRDTLTQKKERMTIRPFANKRP